MDSAVQADNKTISENPSLWDVLKESPEFQKWLNSGEICDSRGEKPFDDVIHPKHYNAHEMECIEEMRVLFGDFATYHFCICNAWKYRERAGLKDGASAEQDHAKADYYIQYAKKLFDDGNIYR